MPVPGNTDWLHRALEDAGASPGAHGFISDLARRTGLARQTLTKVLDGEILEPSVTICRALAGVLGWSTIQVMEHFGILGDGDRKVIGNGPALWKPAQTPAEHYEAATEYVMAVESYVRDLTKTDETFQQTLDACLLLVQCALVRATLATANVREIAMEAS